MNEIYWICTNKELSLEIRYAAARQIQSMRTPKPKRVRKRDYKAEYQKRWEEHE